MSHRCKSEMHPQHLPGAEEEARKINEIMAEKLLLGNDVSGELSVSPIARCLLVARCLLGALVALPKRHRNRTTRETSYSHYPVDTELALLRRHRNATLSAFKLEAPQSQLLHLATHGCFQKGGCPKLRMEENSLLFADRKLNIRGRRYWD